MKLKTFLTYQSDTNNSDSDSDNDLMIEENLHGGRIIKLNDKTIWEVSPQDLHISEIWLLPFPVKRETSNNANYPYYLINLRSKTKILVRPLSEIELEQLESSIKNNQPSASSSGSQQQNQPSASSSGSQQQNQPSASSSGSQQQNQPSASSSGSQQ